jgi:antitoxin HicB
MHSFAYPARFTCDEAGRFLVSFRDFPHAHTDGKDLSEATEEATDCLASVLAHLIANRAEIPAPSQPKRGDRIIPVPLWIAGKLALYLTVRQKKLSNAALARLLGVRETVVRRLLDPAHETKGEKLHAALQALGKQLVVGVQDAAPAATFPAQRLARHTLSPADTRSRKRRSEAVAS